MTGDADRTRLQRSARRVGILVGIASAIVIAGGVAILVAVLLLTSHPDSHGVGGDGHDGDRVVIDVDKVLPWVLVLGLVGVLLLGGVAWLAARWAARPLAEALRLQRAFVSDASHELRTPLTALTSRIQILERRQRRAEPLDATIAELRRDASVLNDVLTDMLLIAEGGNAPDERADVAVCLAAAVQTIRPLAEEADVDVVSHVDDAPAARIPAVTLTRLCVALLDNAVQHAPSGSPVTISARPAGGTVEVRVADAGSGVSPADVDRIFERFARAGEAGRRRGFGLGLALVRETATRYGGRVAIERTSPAGSVFLLVLPAA
ncbi:HAMP domain-containing sensor histidine kinase [Microbacterium sp. X-17]|uniref:sensor histidine kinase n=1 Tax=Microbacterium sp. X-17 TaxID=3144404 RepID=UPI0031F51A1E